MNIALNVLYLLNKKLFLTFVDKSKNKNYIYKYYSNMYIIISQYMKKV